MPGPGACYRGPANCAAAACEAASKLVDGAVSKAGDFCFGALAAEDVVAVREAAPFLHDIKMLLCIEERLSHELCQAVLWPEFAFQLISDILCYIVACLQADTGLCRRSLSRTGQGILLTQDSRVVEAPGPNQLGHGQY